MNGESKGGSVVGRTRWSVGRTTMRISKKALHQIAQVSLEGSKEHYRFVLENSVAYEREVRPTVGRRRRRQLGEHWEKNNHGDSLVLV